MRRIRGIRSQWVMLAAGVIVLAVAYLAYDLIKGYTSSPCESVFQETWVTLGSKLDVINKKGELLIGRSERQRLSDSADQTARTLKTCCIVLQGGKLSGEEFLRCKQTAKEYERQVEKIVVYLGEAEAAKKQGQADLVQQKLAQIGAALTAAESSSQELIGRVAGLSPKAAEAPKKAEPERGEVPEAEPNNTLLEANAFVIGASVAGELREGDQDHFRFRSSSEVRDLTRVRLENLSPALAPKISVYNQDRSGLFERYDATAGANLEVSFVAEPGQEYYFRVMPWAGSGKYRLSTRHLKAYDQHEPNDDVFAAKPLKLGQAVAASILDEKDSDWFKVSGVAEKTVSVRLENLSRTLAPRLTVYDRNRSQMVQHYNSTPSGNLDFTVEAAGGEYYFQVSPWGGAGEYRLTVSQGR